MDWKRKLTSRKFWAMVADFVGMMLLAFHAAESTAAQVSAIIMAGGGVIAYIVGEGLADAAGAAAGAAADIIIEEVPPDENTLQESEE